MGERSTIKGFCGWVSDFSMKSMEMQDTYHPSVAGSRVGTVMRQILGQDLLTPYPARRNTVCCAANLFHLQINEANNPPHSDEESVNVMHM